LALQTDNLIIRICFEIRELVAKLAVPDKQKDHRNWRQQDNNAVQHQEGHEPSYDQRPLVDVTELSYT
jgi:hypothetical protein